MSVDWKSLDEILDAILYQMEKKKEENEWSRGRWQAMRKKMRRQNEEVKQSAKMGVYGC